MIKLKSFLALLFLCVFVHPSYAQLASDTPNRHVFTGHQHDAKTGLIYMGARYYDPDIGRFITQDTYLGDPKNPATMNRYLYALSNPLLYTDPTGNFPVIEGTADGLKNLRGDIIKTAADQNGVVAGVMGLGAGLVGVMEFGTNVVNTAGDLTVNKLASKNSSSFFVQESRRSLSETKATLSNVKNAVVNNPGQVASGIGSAVKDTTTGILRGESESIAKGASFGFEALSGGSIVNASKNAAVSATRASANAAKKTSEYARQKASSTVAYLTTESSNLSSGARGVSLNSYLGDSSKSARYSGQMNSKALPAPTEYAKHHVFNVFRGASPKSQKYRDFFKKHNVTLDDHTIKLTKWEHKQVHKAGNNWTTQWKRWIDENPNATTKDVYQQAGRMMDAHGVNHKPIVKYK